MRSITLLLSAYIGKLNNAEYLNLMSRLRALIETATPEGVGLTAGEMTEFSDSCKRASTTPRRAPSPGNWTIWRSNATAC